MFPFCFRFLQMAPQYFFCNLPPSESKEILQQILDSDRTGTARRTKPQPAAPETKTETAEAESHDRCIIQWPHRVILVYTVFNYLVLLRFKRHSNPVWVVYFVGHFNWLCTEINDFTGLYITPGTLNICFLEQEEFSVGRFRRTGIRSFYPWRLPSCPSGSPSPCGTVSSVRRRKTTFPSHRSQPRPERSSWTSAWLAVKQENVFKVEPKQHFSADSVLLYSGFIWSKWRINNVMDLSLVTFSSETFY